MPDATPNTALLLPPNRSALESALVQTLHTRGHPEAQISTLYRTDADTGISAELLPWLAWSQDVLAWPKGANETQQRDITRQSWALHRRMGTLAGLRDLAAIFGGQVTRAITPPARLFAAPALTVGERNAFLQRYPLLRLYRWRTVGQRQGAMLHRAYLDGGAYPLLSDAIHRILARAYVVRGGVETELTTTERTTTTEQRATRTVTEVTEAGRAGLHAFCAGHPRHLTHTDAARRIYRMQLAGSYERESDGIRRVAAMPGLAPMEVLYDEVAEPGRAAGLFAGQSLGAGALRESSARDRLYRQLHLFDADIAVVARTASLHMNQGLLGMPAHHAQLDLRIQGKALAKRSGRFVQGHLVTSTHDTLRQCMEAMRSVARVSDRIQINTAISRQSTAGEQHFAGAIAAGNWTEN